MKSLCANLLSSPIYVLFCNIQDSWKVQSAFRTNSIWIINSGLIVLFAVILQASQSFWTKI